MQESAHVRPALALPSRWRAHRRGRRGARTANRTGMADYSRQRERMVERQIAARGVHDRDVLEAMRAVPREEFVAGPLREFAYEDSPLPIEAGQTISQPYIVALMIEAAGI